MEKYTRKEVEVILRTSIIQTIQGTMDWIEEQTDIVEDGKILDNAELTIKPNPKMINDYINKRLIEEYITYKL
jgi:hypothetical protein